MFSDTCISFLGLLKETSGFKLQKLILSWFWEAGTLKSRYWQSCVLSEACRRGSFFVSSRFWKFADNFWQSPICYCVISISIFIIIWPFPCVFVSNFPFYYYKKLIGGLVPTLVWPYLNLVTSAKNLLPYKATFIFLWKEKRRVTVQLSRSFFNNCGNASHLTAHFGIITVNGLIFLLLILAPISHFHWNLGLFFMPCLPGFLSHF